MMFLIICKLDEGIMSLLKKMIKNRAGPVSFTKVY